MAKLIGILLILGGIGLGLYYGGWVLFIGGIVDVIEAAKAEPVQSSQLAWGLVKAFLLAEIVGYAIFWACSLVGRSLFVSDTNSRVSGGRSNRSVEFEWEQFMREDEAWTYSAPGR